MYFYLLVGLRAESHTENWNKLHLQKHKASTRQEKKNIVDVKDKELHLFYVNINHIKWKILQIFQPNRDHHRRTVCGWNHSERCPHNVLESQSSNVLTVSSQSEL